MCDVYFEPLHSYILHSIILHCKMHFLFFFHPLVGHFPINYQEIFIKDDLTEICNSASVVNLKMYAPGPV